MSDDIDRPLLRVTVRQDDAYRAVFMEGAQAMACRIEQIIYSSDGRDGCLRDLHRLVKSVEEEG